MYEGIALEHAEDIYEKTADLHEPVVSESETEYPPTPPRSDGSSSRNVSPVSAGVDEDLGVVSLRLRIPKKAKRARQELIKYRKYNCELDPHVWADVTQTFTATKTQFSESTQLRIHLVSRQASKPAFASVAQSYIRMWRARTAKGRAASHGKFELSSETLDATLEGQSCFSSG